MRPHRFPSPYHLHLFIGSRVAVKWSNKKIIDALITRLRLDTVDVDALDDVQRERYEEVMRAINELRETE